MRYLPSAAFILILLMCVSRAYATDSIPPRTVYSITVALQKTSRFYHTHVHNRYSGLDYNTDGHEWTNSAALGINALRMLKPRVRLEVGLMLAFNHFRTSQYNLVTFVQTKDTFYSYRYDEERFYRLSRFSVPVKMLYHLSPRVYPWYATGGIAVSRLLFEDAHNRRGINTGRGIVLNDGFGNEITYYKWQLDYTAGIGKMVRLGPTLQLRIESGYSGSMLSVLKNPDRGWLSAVYLQFGLISL